MCVYVYAYIYLYMYNTCVFILVCVYIYMDPLPHSRGILVAAMPGLCGVACACVRACVYVHRYVCGVCVSVSEFCVCE